jgi:hypothetical protein
MKDLVERSHDRKTVNRMKKKLTLTINQDIIEKAERYARHRGQSLSETVENYLKLITKEGLAKEFEIIPLVKSLRGSFIMPDGFELRKDLPRVLSKKYL